MHKQADALQGLQQMTKLFLTPAEVAPVLGCDPQWIRVMAAQNPDQLGFPVTRIRSRTKIPRIPFIQFVTGGQHT